MAMRKVLAADDDGDRSLLGSGTGTERLRWPEALAEPMRRKTAAMNHLFILKQSYVIELFGVNSVDPQQ